MKNKQLGKEKVKPEDNVIVEITEEFIQEFIEHNYERKLTASELEDLRWAIWEQTGDLMDWIYQGAMKVVRK